MGFWFGCEVYRCLKENGNLELQARDITTTFNAWSFSFTEKEKEALYLTKNDIPVKSTEMTAPRLIVGAARDFRISNKLALLAEANFDLTFDGKRNTVISSDPISVDPKLGLELISIIYFTYVAVSIIFRRHCRRRYTEPEKSLDIPAKCMVRDLKFKI